MRISLVLQCISTWNQMPVESEMQVFINGLLYPHTLKKGGYLILTKEVPKEFLLSITSKDYLPFNIELTSLPEDKIIICEFVMRHMPAKSTLIQAKPPAWIVLGYDYYRLKEDARKGDRILKILNPNRQSAEGKRYLLRDTKSGAEEFLILNDAKDLLLSVYNIPSLNNNFPKEVSVMLPAFYINEHTKIPLRNPPENGAVWIYEEGQETKRCSF